MEFLRWIDSLTDAQAAALWTGFALGLVLLFFIGVVIDVWFGTHLVLPKDKGL